MQFARDTAFQRGHPRSGRSGSSRGGIGRCQQHGERTSWELSPAGQLPPVKSLIKHSHFNSVPLRLEGDGLHKNPNHRVLPLHLPGGSGSPGSVQWDQLTNVCREHRLEQPSLGPGLLPPPGRFSRRQQLRLLLRAAVPARDGEGLHLGDSGEDTSAAALVGSRLCTLSSYLGQNFIHLT